MSDTRTLAFRANNELALHVPDPEAAADFYARALGCRLAKRYLQAAGCTLVPIGPHSPNGFYLRDPSGVVFDVIQRDTAG